MTTSEVVSAGALLVMVVVALVLLIQYLKLQDIWQIIVDCKTANRWAKIWEVENKELRSALRAEKEQVGQLQRKVALLEALVPA
ncbi:hypothetical protein ACIGCH_18180 [Pseudomonas helleri]|uniref:Uncharacterized protein n=1 Tax=Pseudomonas helleri TaxID=1608996 RepID=A0A6A7YYS0_9PSED|nr:hypothetical protein [Pseudomonas helleri]MQT28636.1 hypothetical protein [Pseudomonas helleri]MQT80556.1 hypothetical protein [Pseudomonas helleri]MQU19174.1 hypothetical protein [Pseudomonas helleri]MQU29531.1 hypothetical protein [Pseudomonas helleri]